MGFNKRFRGYGGVQIKLKLGKNETAPSKNDTTGTAEKNPEVKEPTNPAEQQEKKPEPERKIIKFDTPEKPEDKKKEEAILQESKKKMPADATKPDGKKIENIPNVTKIIGDKTPGASTDAAREELEQRRTILQNMKDFDFQIKKNQEDLTNLNEKVENLSKDLDDLVSLYEIVSEQMNPFVGLSKVTKKRIDALENFTKEVETVKTRIGDLESILEKSGVATGGFSPIAIAKPTTEKKAAPETSMETTGTPTPPVSNTPLNTPTAPINEVKPTVPSVTPLPFSQPIPPTVVSSLSDREIDELLSKSLESLLTEQNIDNMINEFFLSLK